MPLLEEVVCANSKGLAQCQVLIKCSPDVKNQNCNYRDRKSSSGSLGLGGAVKGETAKGVGHCLR